MLRWFCWIPAGAECHPLFQWLVCSLLVSTKVDTNNNSMIPKTNLVDSRWWKTRKCVSGWFDVTANKKKGLGILIPSALLKCHFVPWMSLVLYDVSALWLEAVRCSIMQYSGSVGADTLGSPSRQTAHVTEGTCSGCSTVCVSWNVGLQRKEGFYFHLDDGHSPHSLKTRKIRPVYSFWSTPADAVARAPIGTSSACFQGALCGL